MALTPEDVVNKRFQPTKFREGYDQDEVDDFLDEVVVELRRMSQENEELRQRLVGSESRISELQRSGGQSSGVSAPNPVVETPAVTADAEAVVAAPAVDIAPAAAVPAPAFAAPAAELDPDNTNNLLQLARRLHEEHVKEGVEKRDALISEGQATAARVASEAEATAARVASEAEATAARVASEAEGNAARVASEAEGNAARLVTEAETTAARLVSEAEATQRAQIAKLDQERGVLEHRIDELRTFEREYRQKLKGYIEGQLRDLDAAGGVSSSKSDSASYQGIGGH